MGSLGELCYMDSPKYRSTAPYDGKRQAYLLVSDVSLRFTPVLRLRSAAYPLFTPSQ